MNRRRVSDRINMLAGSKQAFNKYLNAYYANERFGGPCVYFHKKVIARIRQKDYEGLFTDEHFIEYIYATLASWGMHRMGPKGSKMRNFEDFKDSIQTNRSTFLELHKFTIEKLTNDDKKVVYPMLGLLLDNIDVMQSESKLVGSSKVIHHLLPDLVPPIDREYTLRFFYGDLTSKYTPLFQKDEESNLFIEIVGYFQNICDKLQLDEGDCDKTKSFNTSIPKIIDNSIIGLV